jgi:hypothetical protein
LIFELNPSERLDSSSGYGRSECSIIVKNLTPEVIAIRVNFEIKLDKDNKERSLCSKPHLCNYST